MEKQMVGLHGRTAFKPSTNEHFFELQIVEMGSGKVLEEQMFGPFESKEVAQEECDKAACRTRDVLVELFGFSETQASH